MSNVIQDIHFHQTSIRSESPKTSPKKWCFMRNGINSQEVTFKKVHFKEVTTKVIGPWETTDFPKMDFTKSLLYQKTASSKTSLALIIFHPNGHSTTKKNIWHLKHLCTQHSVLSFIITQHTGLYADRWLKGNLYLETSSDIGPYHFLSVPPPFGKPPC